MASQERRGTCARCGRDIRVRRHRYASGWGLWVCKRCGQPAQPGRSGAYYLRLVVWSLAMLDIVLTVLVTHPALLRAIPF